MPSPRLLVPALVAALLLPSPAPASAATGAPVPLAGTSFPVLVAGPDGPALRAVREATALEDGTVLTATADEQVTTGAAVDPALGTAALTWHAPDAPGPVEVAVMQDGTDPAAWPADEPLAVEASATLSWRFPAAGTYALVVDAVVEGTDAPVTATWTVEVAPGAPAPAPSDAPADPGAPADPSPPVAPGDEDAPAAAGGPTSDDEPAPGAQEPDAAPQEAAAAGPVHVVDAGDLRLQPRLGADGLTVALLDAGTGEDLDLAATVLALPDAEAWPGGTEDPATWESVAPGRGAVHRTSAAGVGTSPLSLTLDAHALDPAAVSGADRWSEASGGVFTRLGSADGPGTVALLGHGTDLAGTSTDPGAARWLETSPPGGFFTEPELPVAVAITAPGRHCVTVATMLQTADDGTVHNRDVTLTFAVGGTDPAATAPCAQPDAVPAQAPAPVPADAPGTTVLDEGLALLATTVDADGGLRLDVVTSDRGRTRSYDAERVVLAVPAHDAAWPWDGKDPSSPSHAVWQQVAAPGTRLWRTPGTTHDLGVDERANDLVLAFEGGFLDASALDPDGDLGVTWSMTAATTPDDGYLATYTAVNGTPEYPEDAAQWDTRPGGARETFWDAAASPDAGFWPFWSERTLWANEGVTGFAFTAPGVHCVKVQADAALAGGAASTATTLTFAVGVDPAGVTPCAPLDDDEGDGGGPGDGEDLDPSVAWLTKGHVDVGPRVGDDGGLELVTGDEGTVGLHPLADAVWVARGTWATFTVTEPDEYQDRTFLGPPGTVYHGFTQGNSYQNQTLWPGLNTQLLPGDPAPFDRDTTWTLEKASGPGDVVVWDTNRLYLDSRDATTGQFPVPFTHKHVSWAFTAPGVYCLALGTSMRDPRDDATDRDARGLLTVVAGDVDLTQVQPCERTQDVPGPVAAPRDAGTGATDVAPTSPVRVLDLVATGAGVDAVARTRAALGAGTEVVGVEHAVHRLTGGSGAWALPAWDWTTFGRAGSSADVRVTLGAVDGPGQVWFDGGARLSDDALLGTRAGDARAATLWSGHVLGSAAFVDAAGVYCVPLTWSGTAPDGSRFTLSRTLTLAAGVTGDVVPCADGGEGSDPGDGDPDPGGEPVWDVPQHAATRSGATVVTSGHVDLAVRVVDGRLASAVKDDSGPTTVLRDPAGTVLQVRPEAATTVPAAGAYGFLGEPGDAVWMLPETQQEGLLWPGWSSELVPSGALDGDVRWTLADLAGPGELALFQTSAFGLPTVLMASRDGLTAADTVVIGPRVHAHGTWAFSAEGVYCAAFTRTATRADGQALDERFVVAFAVGRTDVLGVDPGACFGDEGAPDDVDTTPHPVGALTPEDGGGVQVLDGDAGVVAGQLVTVQVGVDRAGTWVSVWFDDTRWLGWVRVGASGAVQVRVPTSATPGAHALVVEDRDGALVGWDSLGVRASDGTPPDDGGSDGGDGGEPPAPGIWDVPHGTVNAAGATVLSDGHVDVASVLTDGRLDTRVKDSTRSTLPVWRDPARTVLQLRPSSRATVPAAGFGFLGAAGATVYQVTQNQQPGLLWPGWSTEAIPADATRTGVAWALTDASGPGDFVLYRSSATTLGSSEVLMSTRDGVTAADRFTIPKAAHAHGTWAFTAAGTYCLAFERVARLASGAVSSDAFVLAVAVGTADVMRLDPARCGEQVDGGPGSTPVDDSAAGAGTTTTDGTTAARTVAPAQCVAGGVVLSSGHVDWAARLVGGRLQQLVGDDSSGAKTYREPGSVVLWVKPSARVGLPAGYERVAPAGSTVWQVPQTQAPGLVWLGWSSEALSPAQVTGPVRWTLDAVAGPGDVVVYQSGAFGGVQDVVLDGAGSAYDVPLGVHAHASWAFTRPGVYRLTMTQAATLADGTRSSDTEVLTVAVGDVDPTTALRRGSGCGTVSNAALTADDDAALLQADQAAAAAVRAARLALPGALAAGSTTTAGALADAVRDPRVPALLAALGALLLLGGAGAGVLARRRRSV